MRCGAAILVLLGLLLGPGTSVATAAEPARVSLVLPTTFSFDEATVAVGTLGLGEARVQGLETVSVDALDLPDGTLYVCPARSGQQDQIPPLPVLQTYCRDEDAYEDPQLEIGGRTWLTSRGNLTLQGPIEGTATMLWTPPNASLAWAATFPQDRVPFQMEDDAFAFRPIRASSEISVDGASAQGSYNGTGWIFYLEASGTLELGAAGATGTVPESAGLTLGPASVDRIAPALDPRVLLDLQDAALGADAREPTANATRLFRDHGRIPHLVDGGLLGHLNGTVGDSRLDPGTISFVHVDQADLAVDEGRLVGQAQVAFTRATSGFTTGTGDASGAPWWLAGIAWIAALVTLKIGPDPPERPGWDRWMGLGLGLLAFLVWDASLNRVVGTSAIELLTSDASLGVQLAVLGFELVALLVAWATLYLPVRLTGERWIPGPFDRWTRPALTTLALVAIAVTPGTMIAIGQLVARL